MGYFRRTLTGIRHVRLNLTKLARGCTSASKPSSPALKETLGLGAVNVMAHLTPSIRKRRELLAATAAHAAGQTYVAVSPPVLRDFQRSGVTDVPGTQLL